MKLYTEEQLEEAFAIGVKYAFENRPASLGEHYKYVQNMIESFTPIELPSDEEIDKEAKYREPNNTRRAFFSGAKYVIEQIKKQK